MSTLSRLTHRLFDIFQPNQKDSLKVVILCFLGATVFWFFNSLNKEYTTRINYPIHFEFNRDSVVVLKELPSKVRLDVTSGGWNILRKSIGIDNKPAVIVLNKPAEIKFLTSQFLLPLVADQVPELNVNYVATDTLFFEIEEKAQKKMGIVVDSSSINLKRNYKIISAILTNPDSILVFGPKSAVDTLPPIYTLPLGDDEVDEDFSQDVPIPLNEEPFFETEPSLVSIKFTVEEFISIRKQLPVTCINFPDSTIVPQKPEGVQVTYWIPESRRLQPVDSLFRIEVDYHNLNRKDSTIIPRVIQLPDFVDSLMFLTPQVKVRYD